MGGNKTGTSGTQYQSSSVSIPPEVLARYNSVNARAEDVAGTPFQPYSGEFVAPVNTTQQGGVNTIMDAYGVYGPYAQKALGSIDWGSQQALPYFDMAGNSIGTGVAAGQAGAQAGQQSVATGLGTLGTALNTIGGAYSSAQPYNTAATGQIYSGLAGAQPYNAAAGSGIGTAYSGAQPYQIAATGLAAAGTQAVNPNDLQIGRYMSPYTQSVVQSTMANLGQQQRQEQQKLTGNAILDGSWGGDRAGIAKANLARQQDLASGSVLSGLYAQNYDQALAAAQQQQGVGLGAAQANRAALSQGATTLAGIGNQGFNQGLGAAQAYQGLGNQLYTQGLGAGTALAGVGNQVFGQGRDTAQTQADIGSRQVAAGQAQTDIGNTQFNQGLGAAQGYQNIGQGTYGLAQNYATTTSGLGTADLGAQLNQGQAQLGAGTLQQQTQQAKDSAYYNQFLQQQGYPFQVAQFLANIAMGTGALSGSTTSGYSGGTQPQPYFSDERLKENIHTIGYTNDGQPIIRFNYKGQKGTQLGLSAQETEKHHPEAVGESQGFKTVDYDAATRDAVHKAGGGGLSTGAPMDMASLIAAQQAMYPYAGSNARGIPAGAAEKRPTLITAKPMEAARPASSTTGMQRDISTAKDLTGLASGAGDLAKAGKTAAVGTAASADGKTPAEGGLFGTGGKWDAKEGWFGKQLGLNNGGGGNSGTITTTPLPTPTGSSDGADDVASGLAGGFAGEDLPIDGFFARGGRTGLASGGLPYDSGTGYVPDEVLKEGDEDSQRKLVPAELPKVQQDKGSSGSGMGEAASVLGSAASIAKLGMMFLKSGGAVEPTPENLRRARDAISSIEGNYSSIGPLTGGDRPYGRYQVMGKNLPTWTKEALGRPLTPEQFLADTDAQDRVFDHHFGKAWTTHGSPEDAASVWFTGRPRSQTSAKDVDVLGTSAPVYVDKFRKAFGSGESGGTQAAPKPHVAKALEIVAAPLAVPEEELDDEEIARREQDPSDRHATQLLESMGLAAGQAARGGRQGFAGGGVPEADDMPVLDEEALQRIRALNDAPDRLDPVTSPTSGLAAAGYGPDDVPPPTRSPFGNQRHGGQFFGGETYGGNKFGRSAPETPPPETEAAPALAREVLGLPPAPAKPPAGWGGSPPADVGLGAAAPASPSAAPAGPPAGWGRTAPSGAGLAAGAPSAAPAAPPATGSKPTPAQLEEIRRTIPGDPSKTSLNVPAATGVAAGTPAAAPAPATGVAAGTPAGAEEPGFFDRKGWFGRNERPLMGALGFLGGMLSSPSRQLAGAVGSGLAAAAPMYLGAGQKQQGLDIAQQQANTSSMSRLMSTWQYMQRLADVEKAQNNGQVSPGTAKNLAEIQQQILAAARMLPGASGGPPAAAAAAATSPSEAGGTGLGSIRTEPVADLNAPAGSPPRPPGIEPNAPAAAAPTPETPPVTISATPPAAVQGTDTGATPAYPWRQRAVQADLNVMEDGRQIDQRRNPAALRALAASQTTPEGYQRLMDEAREAENMLKEGKAVDINGRPGIIKGWSEMQRQRESTTSNREWQEKQTTADTSRHAQAQNFNLIADALSKFASNPAAQIESQGAEWLRRAGFNVPTSATTNAAAVQEITKQVANQARDAGNTDMARVLTEAGGVEATKNPEANKQILATLMATMAADNARYRFVQEELKAAPHADRNQIIARWNSDNQMPKFYTEAYKNLPILGATPIADDGRPDVTKMMDGGKYVLSPQEYGALFGTTPPAKNVSGIFKLVDGKPKFVVQ